eukprot:TRINITY_DN42743_c0_g1_i1.p2 TRINITY_DN42743_c0_g1~~TRINITY_DN42743_c0_g1_i1.p2  ORF type:complete len:355 (+),score=181.83 TRINITY_DN42743_c0_g1_i1:196-1260(+)
MTEAKRISEVLSAPRDSAFDNKDGITWSFEFFPPRTDVGVTNLNARLGRMRGMNPEFVDYTWGAGGSTSTLTQDLCKTAQQELGYISNMHLTCTNMEAGKVEEALQTAKDNGIRNIVALRGDPPAGEKEWKACDTGFKCALDLVKFIREKYGDYFCISVAGYPEGHPDKITDYEEYLKVGKISDDVYKSELEYLKAKVDAGADLIISQMFYDADLFLRFVQDCRDIGITVPILPGLLPLQAYPGFRKMTVMCKTYVPKELDSAIETVKPDETLEGDAKKAADQKVKDFGVDQMVEMCKKLMAGGVKHLHFYCLNMDYSTREVLKKLGYVPEDFSDETCEKYAAAAKEHRGYHHQ